MDRPDEKAKLLSYMSEDLWGVLGSAGCFVAGGAITSLFTNRDVNDIDIYFPSQESLKKVLIHMYCEEERMLDEPSCLQGELQQFEAMIVSVTEKAVTVAHNKTLLQLIYFDYYDTAEKIFDSFDFTACMGAYDIKSGEFVLHPEFIYDNSAKRLTVNTKTAFPFISVLRIQKYVERGWTISTKHVMMLSLACNKLKIASWDELKAQMGGMYGYCTDDIFDDKAEFSIAEAIRQLSLLRYEPMFIATPINQPDIKPLLKTLGIEVPVPITTQV